MQEDSSAHAREVKRAIEMILGVPAALNGKADLNALAGEASRRYNKEARKHKDVKEAADAADKLQDEVESLDGEMERLNEQSAGNAKAPTGVPRGARKTPASGPERCCAS